MGNKERGYTKRYENSMLSKTGIEVKVLGNDDRDDTGLPVYSTIQGFKGFDSKVVILFGLDDIQNDAFSRYIYIAGTRARTLLYVVGFAGFRDKIKDKLQKRHNEMVYYNL